MQFWHLKGKKATSNSNPPNIFPKNSMPFFRCCISMFQMSHHMPCRLLPVCQEHNLQLVYFRAELGSSTALQQSSTYSLKGESQQTLVYFSMLILFAGSGLFCTELHCNSAKSNLRGLLLKRWWLNTLIDKCHSSRQWRCPMNQLNSHLCLWNSKFKLNYSVIWTVVYSAIFCTLQLEFWKFKHDIFACELLVDTRKCFHLWRQTILFIYAVYGSKNLC